MTNRPRKKVGPNTAAGKLRSSQNSTEHGLRSEHFRLLPGESPEEFEKLRKSWLDHYQCDDYADEAILLMVEKLAQDDWIRARGTQAVCKAQERLALAEIADQTEQALEALERRLLLMMRYKTAAENSFTRKLKEIEGILARTKREELQDRMTFMRENVTALVMVQTQVKMGLPLELPWNPTPASKRLFKEQQRAKNPNESSSKPGSIDAEPQA